MTIRTLEERAGERDKASVNDVYLFESVLMHNEYIHPKTSLGLKPGTNG